MNSGKEVFIVGGGPSLRNYPFERLTNKDTIAINIAVFDVSNPNYFITVDYSFLNKMRSFRERFINGKYPKIFVADLSYPYLIEHPIKCCIIDTRLRMKYDLSLFNIVIKAKRKEGFGYTFNDFRTGMNSGYCAVQLAIILGYTKIHLLGMDLSVNKKTHYHDMYPKDNAFDKKLRKYFLFFKSGLKHLKKERPDIEVISHSKDSPLNKVIEYKSLEDIL